MEGRPSGRLCIVHAVSVVGEKKRKEYKSKLDNMIPNTFNISSRLLFSPESLVKMNYHVNS